MKVAEKSDRKVAIGSDHAGFELKTRLKAALIELGLEPVDFGTDSDRSADYADFGHAVADAVAGGACGRGVLVCGSGIGMSMTANRHEGVRAALAWTAELGELARRHNDANVLVLPARFIEQAEAIEVLKAFLASPFDGGRHERRVEKIEVNQPPGGEETK